MLMSGMHGEHVSRETNKPCECQVRLFLDCSGATIHISKPSLILTSENLRRGRRDTSRRSSRESPPGSGSTRGWGSPGSSARRGASALCERGTLSKLRAKPRGGLEGPSGGVAGGGKGERGRVPVHRRWFEGEARPGTQRLARRRAVGEARAGEALEAVACGHGVDQCPLLSRCLVAVDSIRSCYCPNRGRRGHRSTMSSTQGTRPETGGSLDPSRAPRRKRRPRGRARNLTAGRAPRCRSARPPRPPPGPPRSPPAGRGGRMCIRTASREEEAPMHTAHY